MGERFRLITLASFFLFCCIQVLAYEDGDVKVINANNVHHEGVLEMYLDSLQWSTFCISSFDKIVANLSCRQLGYSKAYKYGTVIDLGYNKMVERKEQCVSFMQCPENAINIKSCSYSISSEYDEESVVALVCENTNQDSLAKSKWALAFGVGAFVIGAMVILAVSIVKWLKKRSFIAKKQGDFCKNDSAILLEDDCNLRHPCIYPPKYSEVELQK